MLLATVDTTLTRMMDARSAEKKYIRSIFKPRM